MGKRGWGHRNDSGSYLPVLLAGGGLLCAVAPALGAADAGLQLSMELGSGSAARPVFREDAGPEFRLSPINELDAGAAPAAQAPGLSPPFRPAELPMRLAQALMPPNAPGRQPRWSTRYDTPLTLQPTREMDMPGAAGIGRPQPTGDAVAPVSAPEIEDDVPSRGGRGPAKPAIALDQPAAAEDESKGASWVIPPIRWVGSVGYTLRHNSSNSGLKTLDQLISGNIRASSYIYAPWLATVSGDLGVVTGTNESSGGDSFGSSQQTKSLSLVGGGSLDLFPASRFPFNATLNRSDSRVTGTSLSSDYTNTRLGLRQSYRSEDGQHSVSANFDHSTVSMQNGQKDTVNALSGNYTVPLGPFSNTVTARVSVSERDGTGEGATLLSLNSSHSYKSENNFSLQAYSNYTDNNLRYGNGSGISQSRGQFLQLNTSASWQPEFEDTDDLPLTLTGGLLYFASRTGESDFSSQSQRISGTVSAYYRFSPNLSVNGSGTLNHFTTNGGQASMVSLLTGGVAYAGDPLMFGNFSYNWNSGANMSWQSGSGNTGSSLFTNAQAGHSLGRNFIISPTDSVSLNLSQNLSVYQTQAYGNTESLSNNAMVSYRLGLGDQFNGAATTTLSDVMTSGASGQHYRSLNVGLNGFGQLSPRSSASVNLSFNWSDQTIKNTTDSFGQPTNTQRMNMAGSASYNHVRFAGVPGLRYSLLFSADTTLRDARMFGDVNGRVDRARHTIDNRLDYRVGLLDTRLSFTINDVGGKKNALLFFQVSRQIGAY